MVGDIVGFVTVVADPKHSTYYKGKVTDTNCIGDLANKTLRVWEKNDHGDCLCLNPDGNGLVDIDGKDVHHYLAVPQLSPAEQLASMISKLKEGMKE